LYDHITSIAASGPEIMADHGIGVLATDHCRSGEPLAKEPAGKLGCQRTGRADIHGGDSLSTFRFIQV
jgi:hypothetical protein